MADVDFDYPPTRTLTLGSALEEYAPADGEGEDADDIEAARSASIRDGLQWAIAEWGEDAAFELQAYTAGTRAEVLDRLHQNRVGEVGQQLRRNWFIAAAITDAPWIDGDTPALADRVEAVAALPPALVDWLNEELAGLNDLGNP